MLTVVASLPQFDLVFSSTRGPRTASSSPTLSAASSSDPSAAIGEPDATDHRNVCQAEVGAQARADVQAPARDESPPVRPGTLPVHYPLV